MNIGIIGLGYVGLTLGIAAADNGVTVYGTEISDHIKSCLRENKAHFYEPGLNNLIRRHNGRDFFVVEEFPGDVEFDAFIITVGTPLTDEVVNNVKQPNFDYIRSALKSIKPVYNGDQMIILRSTVSVGTTRNVVMPFLSELCGRQQDDIRVGMCPERTIEGKAIYELTHLPQIISGNNDTAVDIAQRLFRQITPFVIKAGSIEEAELVKLYCNTYRDMTFAIGNAFCMAAQKFGVNGIDAILHANEGYGRSNIAYPGFVAGPCLEKDAYILINNMPDCDSKDFILAARKYNESLEDMVVEWVESRLGDGKGKRSSKSGGTGEVITVSGMAFKGQPETSDLRGSSSVYIARKLKDAGFTVNLHDFVASREEMEDLGIGEVYSELTDACRNSRLLLILNNHKKYSDVLYDKVFSRSERGFAIFDAWRACAELYYSDDVDICTLGDFNISK